METETETDRAPRHEQAPGSDGDSAGQLRTFLIADVRGYTRYTQAHGDEAAAQLAGRFAEGARVAVAEHDGRVVELRGDEALAVFSSPRQALRAAIEVQRRLRGAYDPEDALPLGVGIGLDTGEAVPVEGGFRGKALNVAARLCSLARPGEVLATETLSALAGRVPGVRYVPRKPVRVKGIEQPVRLVEAVPDEPLPPLPQQDTHARPERRRLAASGVLAALVLLTGGVALWLALGGEGQAVALEANSLGRLDTGSGAVREQLPVGAGPADVVSGAGSLWVVNREDASLWRVDLARSAVTDRVPVGVAPSACAFGDGAVWVVDGVSRRLLRVDARTGGVVKRYEVGNGASAVTFAQGAAWVANTVDGTVTRIDARTGASRSITVGVEPVALASDRGAVWVANRGSNNVVRLDVGAGALEPIAVGHEPSALAVGGGALWVANAADGTVWKIDPVRAAVLDTVAVGRAPRALAYAGGAAWVASEAAGAITRIAPDGEVTTHAVGGSPTALEAVGAELWVTALAARATHRGGTLRIAGPFPITDPYFMSFGANVNPLLNDGLVGYRAVGGPAGAELVPNLAEAIPRPTDGGRRYTFRMRRGVRFSTGADVKPSDVRASLQRMFAVQADLAEVIGGGLVDGPACLESPAGCDLSRSVLADDESRTVTFVLSERDPAFLYKLAYPPAWVLPANTPRTRVETKPLAATGPYMIERVEAGRQMTLVRNPHFREWSRDAQPAGFPDRIEIRESAGPAPLRLVAANRADAMVGDMPPVAVRRLAVRFPARVRSAPANAILTAVLNTNRPPFDDVRVRKALNLAVDRRAVVAALGGPLFGRPTCQLVPPNVLGYRPFCPYTRNAKAGVWSEADLERGRRLVRTSGTAGSRVTVWTSRWPPFRELGEVLERALDRLGYRAETRVFGGTTFDYYNAFGPSRTAQVGVLRWGLDLPVPMDVFGPLLACEGGLNATKLCDRRLDESISAAAQLMVTNRGAAAPAWARLDRSVVERALHVPLVNPSSVQVFAERVGNVQLHPVWGPLYGQMWVR